MSTKFAAAIAVVTAVTTTFAFAQNQPAPKASKAEVQKVVGGIKSDKAKLAQYCEITKLEVQANALAEKIRAIQSWKLLESKWMTSPQRSVLITKES